MRYIVAHTGVPIGEVDLPAGRRWAGGLLAPLAAFEAVRPVIAAASAAGVDVAVDVLTLPAEAAIDVRALDPPIAAAVTRLAALTFELWDEAGLAVATDVVRLADPGDGLGVRVRAFFASASSGVAARHRPAHVSDGRSEPPSA